MNHKQTYSLAQVIVCVRAVGTFRFQMLLTYLNVGEETILAIEAVEFPGLSVRSGLCAVVEILLGTRETDSVHGQEEKKRERRHLPVY